MGSNYFAMVISPNTHGTTRAAMLTDSPLFGSRGQMTTRALLMAVIMYTLLRAQPQVPPKEEMELPIPISSPRSIAPGTTAPLLPKERSAALYVTRSTREHSLTVRWFPAITMSRTIRGVVRQP